MQTSRLRLYTKNITYVRMLMGIFKRPCLKTITTTEQLIADYTGAKYAILTSMGRMAIYEGLQGLKTKGEIIVSPITVPEVISLIHAAGFKPVFCEVKQGTWNIDINRIESLITPQTVAIMTTHFYGDMVSAEPIRQLCNRYQLKMIEDAAQALGSWHNGKHAGTIGDFGILSFSYPKNVTSFYGGCIITNNEDIAHHVRKAIHAYPPVDRTWLNHKTIACAIKDIGTWPPIFQITASIIRYGYQHNIRSIIELVQQSLTPAFLDDIPTRYLTRMSPQQAQAIADKWPEIDEDVSHRIQCAEIYHQAFAGIKEIIQPRLVTDRSHGYLYYPIQVPDSQLLQRFMIDHHCDVAIQNAPNCADLELYKIYYRDCPIARAACANTITLPTYPGFPLKQAVRYANIIKEFFAR